MLPAVADLIQGRRRGRDESLIFASKTLFAAAKKHLVRTKNDIHWDPLGPLDRESMGTNMFDQCLSRIQLPVNHFSHKDDRVSSGFPSALESISYIRYLL